MIILYPFLLPANLRFDFRFDLFEQCALVSIILLCLIGSCVSIQIVSALTCRPFEILFDLRFISILTTQLLGFIGCLLFAYKFGSMFGIKIPENISHKKTLFIPLSQSFVIDLK
jgi:hypothetical protein